jgi:hypothetical protein
MFTLDVNFWAKMISRAPALILGIRREQVWLALDFFFRLIPKSEFIYANPLHPEIVFVIIFSFFSHVKSLIVNSVSNLNSDLFATFIKLIPF